MQNVQGYLRRHWTPPLGKYSPRISPADAMVIDLWPKKSSCGIEKSLCSKASVQKARNEPSIQLNEATSCVKRLNATIKADQSHAKEHS
jgi:hypothetical protein